MNKEESTYEKISKEFDGEKNFETAIAKTFIGDEAGYNQINLFLKKLKSYRYYRQENNTHISNEEKEEMALVLLNIKNLILEKMKFFNYTIREHNASINENIDYLPNSLCIEDLNDEFDYSKNLELNNIELLSKIINWSNKAAKSCKELVKNAIKDNPKNYNHLRFDLANTIHLENQTNFLDNTFLDLYQAELLKYMTYDEISNNKKYNFFNNLLNEKITLETTIEKYKENFGNKKDDNTLIFLTKYNNSLKEITIKDAFIKSFTDFVNMKITKEELLNSVAMKEIKKIFINNPQEFDNLDAFKLYHFLVFDDIASKMYDIKNLAIDNFFKEFCYMKKNNLPNCPEIYFTKHYKNSDQEIYNTILTINFPDYFNKFSAHFDPKRTNCLTLDEKKILLQIPYKNDTKINIKSILNFKLSTKQIYDIMVKNRKSKNIIINRIADFYNSKFKNLSDSKRKELKEMETENYEL